jgi:CubicO group peptidase (beta-lactamase class C family)
VRCEPDTLFLLWSTGKPFLTMAVHLLAERGLLDLDGSVHHYWPGYERNVKGAVTARHVLRHRSGVPLSTGSVLLEALAMSDWDRPVHAAENARPKWLVDQVTAYHILNYGFILGELVRRVDGRPIEYFVREEILHPAGLLDTQFSLSLDLRTRRATLVASPRTFPTPRSARRGSPAVRWKFAHFERLTTADQIIPAANARSTTRDIARFYQLLLDEGSIDDVCIFDPKNVAEARRHRPPLRRHRGPQRVRLQRQQLLQCLGRSGPGPRPRLPDQPRRSTHRGAPRSGPTQ